MGARCIRVINIGSSGAWRGLRRATLRVAVVEDLAAVVVFFVGQGSSHAVAGLHYGRGTR